MIPDKQVPTSGYCPVQKKDNYTVWGNYFSDGFGGYALGTIYCPYKELAKVCTENPCPMRASFPQNL